MSQSTESTTESNPFTKPGFIIAAALVVALIAAAVVIFLLPKGQGNAQPAPAPSESGNSATASPSASTGVAKSVCGLPTSSETTLGTAPKSKWELVGRMATPTDPETFGPGVTDESGFRSCFAHTPTGALYAAMNVAALGSTGSPELATKLADKLLVPGPGRDAAMQDASTVSSSGNNTTVQVRGFLIKSYTPSEANIDLAFETNNGALGHSTLSMRWIDGDWKVKPADDGVTFSSVAQLRDLSGFILWSGV